MTQNTNINEYTKTQRCGKGLFEEENTVNVFFAADKKYLPYLAVAIASLSDHASDKYSYSVRILTKDLTEKDVAGIKRRVKENVRVSVCDISDKIFHIKEELALRLRDYYSDAIYYRIFIPSVFSNLDRAVYLDSDIVLCEDVAKLYFSNIADNILGAVSDESVLSEPVFRSYVKNYIGLESAEKYFNSGVLIMNLEKIRTEKIKERFLYLLCKYNFKTVAPDQDYLNFLCAGKVKYLERGWNKHAIHENPIEKNELYLMHYNMFNKPWRYDNVQNEELFWKYAKKTDFEKDLLLEKQSYSEKMKENDAIAGSALIASAKELAKSQCEISFAKIKNGESKSKPASPSVSKIVRKESPKPRLKAAKKIIGATK